jgi:hypothetical protein
MEEGSRALRVLNEIGSARAAMAASYMRLWRAAALSADVEPVDPEPAGEQASATPEAEPD